MKRYLLALACSAASTAAYAGTDSLEVAGLATREGSYVVDEPVHVAVENPFGSVEIREADEAHVEWTVWNRRAVPAAVVFTSDGRGLTVRIEPPLVDPRPSAMQVRLILALPRDFLRNLNVRVDSGIIDFSAYFAGPRAPKRIITLQTTSGGVNCEGVCALGRLEIRSESVRIELSKIVGPVRAFTKTGTIDATTTIGRHQLTTETGEIVHRKNIGHSILRSSSGRVWAVDNAGNVDIQTEDGPVDIEGHDDGGVKVRSQRGVITVDNPNAFFEDLKVTFGAVTTTPGVPTNGTLVDAPQSLGLFCADDLVERVERGW